jgi:ABC-type amino acid transport substrate-binding protein
MLKSILNGGGIMRPLFLKITPVVVIISMMLVSWSTSSVIAVPIAASASTPTAILAPTKTITTPQSDDVWDRIQKNNKIVVGTSWGYPPFSTVDTNSQVVGYDMALIQEIGRRLDIPIEIQNYSFNGLSDALQTNKIDLTVAAISETPENAKLMSFSPIYYIDETAVLARNDNLVPNITKINQLVNFRVGVQNGSIYESMAQTDLVDSGLMKADKLLKYMQTDEAIQNLIEKRVDAVILGQATASYFAIRENLIIVGKGLKKQNIVAAMRQGTPRLNTEVSKVMNEMLTDGTILGFIQQYMLSDVAGSLSPSTLTNQASVKPGTPVPSVTPPACEDGMKFISDVTYGDNNMENPPYIKPGKSFVKIWRVQNTGTCTWTPKYHFGYAYGNVLAAQMSGQRINIPVNVAPGKLLDLSVSLVAPNEPLTYQGFWQMENETGKRFGQTIWVAVTTILVQPTPVITAQPSGDCVVTNISPVNSIQVNTPFDTIWEVKNKSGEDWSADSVDYKYVSGAKMHEKAAYDFNQTIKDGESGNITVDMVAPASPGVYSTNWAIVSGTKVLCNMTVSVKVIQ